MATSIVNPSGSVPGFDQISNSFGQIYNMFAPNATNPTGITGGNQGGGSGPFGISPLTNPDNSLTGAWYNMYNLAGPTAASFARQGSGLVDTGTGVAQGGIDMSAGGYGTTQTGLATMQPSIDFYTKLASGDPTAMAQALAPGATAESNIVTNALALNQGGVRGGMQALENANLGTKLAGDVGTAALQLQPAALQQLATLGGEQAQIGGTQAQIGSGVSGVGTNLAGVGTTLTGQGQTGLDTLIADIIQKMSINYANSGPNQFASIAGGIGQLLGGAGGAARGISGLNL